MQIMLNVIEPYILLAFGVILIAIETFMLSFVVIWFGIGFIVVAGISYFYNFSDGVWQFAFASLISLILLFLFRKKFLDKFSKSQVEVSDNFFDEKGVGEIKNSKVFYKGTFWEIDSDIDEKEFFEGEKVVVTKASNNKAIIEKDRRKIKEK